MAVRKIIENFIENIKKVGIKIKICLIFGLPGEPKDIVNKTVKFIEKYKPDYISLSGFCPMPGSPIYKDPQKYDIEFIDKNWDKHAHLLYRFSDNEHVGLPFKTRKILSGVTLFPEKWLLIIFKKFKDGYRTNQWLIKPKWINLKKINPL